MKVKKIARKTERAAKLQEVGEAAHEEGKYRKARRKFKKNMRITNKLEGTDSKPAWSNKEFRQGLRNRK